MNADTLRTLCYELIAFCQRFDILSTTTDELADELQEIAACECYISKMEILEFLES